MSEICDLCGSTDLRAVYRAPDTLRDLTVHVCQSCGLAQSLPRVHTIANRQRAVSSGANWGNIRYGKGFRTAFALQMIENIKPLSSFHRVLDVGSNRGSFLFTLEQQYPHLELWGVEPDPSILPEYRDHPAVNLQNARLEDSDLPEGFFDLVYCSHTLEHVASPREVLAKIRRLMAPDGLFYAEVPNLDFVAGKDTVEEFFIDKHLYHYSLATFEASVEEAGFGIVDTSCDRENVTVLAKLGPSRQARPNATETERANDLVGTYDTALRSNRAELAKAAQRISGFAPKTVAVWGGGRIFDSLVIYGGLDPKLLCGLIDRDLPKFVETIHGIPVRKPDSFSSLAPDVLVIASRAYFDEIKGQAEKLATWPLQIHSVFELMNPNNDFN